MFLWPAAGCAHLAAVSTSPRVFSRPAPAHKAYANLPDRLRCAQTNYFAHLQPRMRNRCLAVKLLDFAGWRIYNVVGSVKYFLNTPHPRRAERLDGVPGARIARAEPVVLFHNPIRPQQEVQLVPPLTNASPKLQPTSSR